MARYFTEDHEWLEIEGDLATVGITAHAQSQLGDVVFVELPEPGRSVRQGEEVAVVESVKAASDVYAPIAGVINESNLEIVENPALVNEDAEGSGWFFKVKLEGPDDRSKLMEREAYLAFVANLD